MSNPFCVGWGFDRDDITEAFKEPKRAAFELALQPSPTDINYKSPEDYDRYIAQTKFMLRCQYGLWRYISADKSKSKTAEPEPVKPPRLATPILSLKDDDELEDLELSFMEAVSVILRYEADVAIYDKFYTHRLIWEQYIRRTLGDHHHRMLFLEPNPQTGKEMTLQAQWDYLTSKLAPPTSPNIPETEPEPKPELSPQTQRKHHLMSIEHAKLYMRPPKSLTEFHMRKLLSRWADLGRRLEKFQHPGAAYVKANFCTTISCEVDYDSGTVLMESADTLGEAIAMVKAFVACRLREVKCVPRHVVCFA